MDYANNLLEFLQYIYAYLVFLTVVYINEAFSKLASHRVGIYLLWL